MTALEPTAAAFTAPLPGLSVAGVMWPMHRVLAVVIGLLVALVVGVAGPSVAGAATAGFAVAVLVGATAQLLRRG